MTGRTSVIHACVDKVFGVRLVVGGDIAAARNEEKVRKRVYEDSGLGRQRRQWIKARHTKTLMDDCRASVVMDKKEMKVTPVNIMIRQCSVSFQTQNSADPYFAVH